MTKISPVLPHELHDWLERDEAVLIDVREPQEYHQQAIQSGPNVPLGTVSKDTVEVAEGETRKVVLYCKAGVRSFMACQKLQAEQVSYDVWNLEGGIEAWKASGLPVTIPE
ncbi:MAG: rhodanese-like domain-containing protein [Rickettsiales bacterium]|nr:rhodanese-like domain-containing protein [Rickettsiales bacterium]